MEISVSYRCDCFQPEPYTDHDCDVVCLRCRRVLHVGPLGINRLGPAVGRGDSATTLRYKSRKSAFAESEG